MITQPVYSKKDQLAEELRKYRFDKALRQYREVRLDLHKQNCATDVLSKLWFFGIGTPLLITGCIEYPGVSTIINAAMALTALLPTYAISLYPMKKNIILQSQAKDLERKLEMYEK